MYWQAQLPIWGVFTEDVKTALMPEGLRILEELGNHPSFVMFGLGNELTGSREVMDSVVEELRDNDSRHLFTQGSNNYFFDPKVGATDDFWATMRTAKGNKFNVRGAYTTGDGGRGIIQVGAPGTQHDYSAAIDGISLPVIGHEVGQFSVFPNFKEIEKYTGVFKARNFEIFRNRLDQAGMLDQADDFFRASGQLSAICYRQEIEIALATPGFGGFDLLDLQDFPGQGSALVGILDAFMDSKGIITPEKWREFCAPQVLLARFDHYTWTNDQSFEAKLQLANYGATDVSAPLDWQFSDADGKILQSGALSAVSAEQGGLRDLGSISFSLREISAPTKLILKLSLRGTEIQNHYPVWVYPAEIDTTPPAGVTLTQKLDRPTFEKLAQGGRVVFSPPPGSSVKSIQGGFISNFWGWWHGKNVPTTTGFLCDPAHPALRGFPTEYHTNWQWFHLLKGSQPAVLQGLMKGKPIVQMIDNKVRSNKLGLIFEFRVGEGKLLVCMADLTDEPSQPEARQLLRSLLDYAASDDFDPDETISQAELSRLNGVINVRAAASSAHSEHPASLAVDDDPTTIWHSDWTAEPQSSISLTLDMLSSKVIDGFAYLPRQDGNNGLIAGYTTQISTDGELWRDWGEPGTFPKTKDLQSVKFPKPVKARYLRLTVTRVHKGRGMASVAEFRPSIDEKATASILAGAGGNSANATSEHPEFTAELAVDNDPNTIWHSDWREGGLPSISLTIDLGSPKTLEGFTYLPRQDKLNGRIANYHVQTSLDDNFWQDVKTAGTFPNSGEKQTVKFEDPVDARYLRIIVTRDQRNQGMASAAEIKPLLADPKK